MKYVKIPFAVLMKVVADAQLLKAYVIYLKLKTLYKEQTIHNIKGRIKELARFTGMCENTFRTRLNQLIDLGLARKENGILFLADNYKLFYVLNILHKSRNGKIRSKTIKLAARKINEHNLMVLAMKIKTQQIEWRQKKNFFYHMTGSCKTNKRLYNRYYSYYNSLKNNTCYNFGSCDKGFLDANLSVGGIAKLFGKKSAKSGHNIARRLEKKGLITYQHREIVYEIISERANLEFFREIDPTLRMKKVSADNIPPFLHMKRKQRKSLDKILKTNGFAYLLSKVVTNHITFKMDLEDKIVGISRVFPLGIEN